MQDCVIVYGFTVNTLFPFSRRGLGVYRVPSGSYPSPHLTTVGHPLHAHVDQPGNRHTGEHLHTMKK